MEWKDGYIRIKPLCLRNDTPEAFVPKRLRAKNVAVKSRKSFIIFCLFLAVGFELVERP